ncbi:hypothetical protein [Vampirovibrio sp.]|uniref:hypothetical protein n=1 Tax=Vampirovibrio sp. TaxID=2717857 RepID=UPI00359303EC
MVMEANKTSYYPKPCTQPRKTVQQAAPKFSGALDSFSSLIGIIDSNRHLELMASDGIGMILPRTAMAYNKRGPDDGRETFLREFSGLIGNVLITGWFGWGMLKLLGNRVNAYNPHGLALDAHINAVNMDAFNQLYEKALKESDNANEARSKFVEKVLGGLNSDNPQFMWKAQQGAFDKLNLNSPEAPKIMLKTLSQVVGEENAKAMLEDVKDQPFEQQLKILGSKLDQQNGKLSEEALGKLAQMFQPKNTLAGSDLSPDAGTLTLDKEAEARIKHWEKSKAHGEAHQKLKNPAFRQNEKLKARLDIYKDSKRATEAFLELVDKTALYHGVTGTVHINDGKQTLASGQSRKNVLRELKYYLEHFVDRASHETQETAHTAKEQLLRIEEKLFKQAKGGVMAHILPKAEDGLISAAIKQKHALTWVPITLAIGTAGLFTFYNQYITAQKHGGKMFFPGEVSPTANPQGLKTEPLGTQQQNLPLNRNFQPFSGFQQGRSTNGGIMA